MKFFFVMQLFLGFAQCLVCCKSSSCVLKRDRWKACVVSVIFSEIFFSFFLDLFCLDFFFNNSFVDCRIRLFIVQTSLTQFVLEEAKWRPGIGLLIQMNVYHLDVYIFVRSVSNWKKPRKLCKVILYAFIFSNFLQKARLLLVFGGVFSFQMFNRERDDCCFFKSLSFFFFSG